MPKVEVIEPEEVEEVVEQEAEATEQEAEQQELVVQIGDDEPEEQERAPDWVRELRKSSREKDKRIKELEAKLQPADEDDIGPEPKLDDPDIDYDSAVFARRLREWDDKNAKREKRKAEQQEAQARQDEAWKAKLSRYEEGKGKLGVSDFDEAEAFLLETFNETQRGALIQGAKDPSLLAYAMWKNPTKAKELAAIPDIVEFIWSAANVEGSLKTTNRGAPPPERKITGDVSGVSSADNTLDRLRSEAEKTGDYSKVMQYRRQMKQKA